MKTAEVLHVCGSVYKTEPLVEIKWNILDNTCVAEANSPYINYYGRVPQKPSPNSLFFFTNRFYFLEDLLRAVKTFEPSWPEKINVASSILKINNDYIPAIRIKGFPDYKNLALLQKYFIEQEFELIPKVHLPCEAKAQINKCFIMEKLDEGIYLDLIEEHKGYVTVPGRLNPEDFKQAVNNIRHNTACKLFDAVQVCIIKNVHVIEMVRVFAEGLDIKLLKNVKKELAQ